MTILRSAMWMGATTALGLTLAGTSCNDSGGAAGTDMGSATAPLLTSVAPTLGPTSGNTLLTVTGANFVSGTTVQIGANMATGVAFVSPTQLTAMLPSQPTAFGKVPVVVARPDGQKAMRSDLFSYFAVTVDFATGLSLGAGTVPQTIATGDFNGDGRVDMIVGNQGSKDLTVLFSTASFPIGQQATISTGGMAPLALAVGDLNGDQKLDLVFITSAGTAVNVMLGNGTGGFAAPMPYAAGTGTRALVLADLNGDKSPDVVVVNNTQGVSVLLSTGDGKLAAATPYLYGALPSAVAAGDFNGDGKIDILVSDNNANNSALLLGIGDGKLTAALSIKVGTPSTAVAVGDFNGDGKLDAMFLSGTGVVFSPGNGSGGFGTAVPANIGTSPYGLSAGDFNGDGISDLAMIDIATYTAYIYIGSTAGLGTPKMYGTGMSPDSLAIGDFDGDQRPDIAIANQGSNDVTILINKAQ